MCSGTLLLAGAFILIRLSPCLPHSSLTVHHSPPSPFLYFFHWLPESVLALNSTVDSRERLLYSLFIRFLCVFVPSQWLFLFHISFPFQSPFFIFLYSILNFPFIFSPFIVISLPSSLLFIFIPILFMYLLLSFLNLLFPPLQCKTFIFMLFVCFSLTLYLIFTCSIISSNVGYSTPLLFLMLLLMLPCSLPSSVRGDLFKNTLPNNANMSKSLYVQILSRIANPRFFEVWLG